MRCPKCGKEIDGLCLNCTNLDELVWLDDLEVITCPRCGSFKVEGKWKVLRLEEVIDHLIFKLMRVHPELEVEDILVEYEPFTVRIRGLVSNTTVEVVKYPNLKILKETCIRCNREAGGYYESILQLRADGRALERKEIERANEIIDEVLLSEKDNQKAFVTKVVERKEGIDYFFGGRDIGRKVSRKLINEFGGEIKESKTISGRMDGKDLYRFTYLVRLPIYKNGDVVIENGKICVVTNARLKKAMDIKNRQTVTLKNPELIAKKGEIKKGIVVQMDEHVVELIHSVTKKVVFAEKTAEFEIGDEVFILECDDKFYTIPKELMS
ncbi:hypothetical protein DRO97_04145 [Archaeoglobales archaeon]|nr:MAG: hypothetical protein DRO97_04145 [Archaeoglobales archaeon]